MNSWPYGQTPKSLGEKNIGISTGFAVASNAPRNVWGAQREMRLAIC
jgi:hypothetical protein